MIWSHVRTLVCPSLADTAVADLASATPWRSPVTLVTACRVLEKSLAWAVGGAYGVHLCQGVWVRGQLLSFAWMSRVWQVSMVAFELNEYRVLSCTVCSKWSRSVLLKACCTVCYILLNIRIIHRKILVTIFTPKLLVNFTNTYKEMANDIINWMWSRMTAIVFSSEM